MKSKSQANLENFVKKRLVVKNSWQRYVYHQADTSGIPYLPTMLEYNWDRDINDFAATTQVQLGILKNQEHRNTEQRKTEHRRNRGILTEHRNTNTGGTPEHWRNNGTLTEQSKYDRLEEQKNSSRTTVQ